AKLRSCARRRSRGSGDSFAIAYSIAAFSFAESKPDSAGVFVCHSFRAGKYCAEAVVSAQMLRTPLATSRQVGDIDGHCIRWCAQRARFLFAAVPFLAEGRLAADFFV